MIPIVNIKVNCVPQQNTLLLNMPRSKTNRSNKSNNSTSTNGYESAEQISPSNVGELLDLMEQRTRVPSSAPMAPSPKRARTNNENDPSESTHTIEDVYQKIDQVSTFLLSSAQNVASNTVATIASEVVENVLAPGRIPTVDNYMFNESLYSQYNGSETCCSDENRQIIQSLWPILPTRSQRRISPKNRRPLTTNLCGTIKETSKRQLFAFASKKEYFVKTFGEGGNILLQADYTSGLDSDNDNDSGSSGCFWRFWPTWRSDEILYKEIK
ncbi:hypothetical protein PHYBLDRAFT_168467 [Phycomyces blakesleeanus NRRL 1555(-)]|uniref:Uncharacterized protein n=1 Tax=Phycomyces blakesleeanus (strain ATCC 8743b / DSM 1359 / FGSC 10004 / NBRC 33097 / NRRL 1555) TaxID=763407 RepID=A0A167MUS5_PHYB8|nr:hypothetical protein PHYBLDRAFT_168467 [Phycomyces blakesleeanus NRRL 1555(-)]OAD74059.1 hypothetical protein PHYBLDRAFT_168467 [Phycomyces blakesleeanus NRRL 1555(-)]|eukprot:XP_018292099.1 hypothetical protein PHYBLDRAFT_168467 [Phycomyces blakesleeanus NRRL 1555(-)]